MSEKSKKPSRFFSSASWDSLRRNKSLSKASSASLAREPSSANISAHTVNVTPGSHTDHSFDKKNTSVEIDHSTAQKKSSRLSTPLPASDLHRAMEPSVQVVTSTPQRNGTGSNFASEVSTQSQSIQSSINPSEDHSYISTLVPSEIGMADPESPTPRPRGEANNDESSAQTTALSEAEHPDFSKVPVADIVDETWPGGNSAEAKVPSPKDISWNHIPLITVNLKEATIDSPSFRASSEHVDTQIRELNNWLHELVVGLDDVSAEIYKIKDKANNIISMFMPSFASENILHQDYTHLLFERYTEAFNLRWTAIISLVKHHDQHVSKLYQEFYAGPYSSYVEQKSVWTNTQARYDSLLNAYMSLSRRASASEARAAAVDVYHARKTYLRASLDLSEATGVLELAANKLLVAGLSHPFRMNKMAVLSPKDLDISVDMHRLSVYITELEAQYENTRPEFERAKMECLSQINRAAPSRDINDFAVLKHETTGRSLDGQVEMYGWLFLKSIKCVKGKYEWKRCWAFIRGGVFGWLYQSASKTYVQESEKFSVLLLQAHSLIKEERRHCFLVQTLHGSLVFQAESNSEVQSWLDVLESSKTFEPAAFEGEEVEVGRVADQDYSLVTRFTEDSTSSKTFGSSVSPRSSSTRPRSSHDHNYTGMKSFVDRNHKSLMEFVSCPMSADGSTSLGTTISTLAPNVMSNKPIATSKSLESMIASAYMNPGKVPNALTANYWGSVNWSTFQDPAMRMFRAPRQPKYPEYLPPTLKFQDMDMRSTFEGRAVYRDENDLVVLVLRGFLQIGVNKHIPARVFITPRRLYAYAHWLGFAGLGYNELENMISIEVYPGENYDDLRVVSRKDERYKLTALRFYVDSGSLAQRRLQFLVDNAKSNNPLGLDRVLQHLAVVGKEYESEVNKGLRLLNNYGPKPFTTRDPEFFPSINFAPEDKDSEDKMNSKWIDSFIARSVPRAVKRGFKLSPEELTQSTKLVLEKTYDLPPKVLYYAMFGDKSPVFLSRESKNPRSMAWYFEKSEVKRKVWGESSLSQSFIISEYKAAMTQYIGHSEENRYYSIIETSPVYELPRGSQFYCVSWYILTASKNSRKTKVRCYQATVWVKKQDLIQSITDNVIFQQYTTRVERILDNASAEIRAMDDPKSVFEATKLFGRVKGSIVQPSAEDNEDIEPERLSGADYYILFVYTPIAYLLSLGPVLVRQVKSFLSANTILMMIMAGSLALNLLLVMRVSQSSWLAYWSIKKADDYASSIMLHPVQGSAFRRHIYSSEIAEAIETGDLGHDVLNMASTNNSANLCYARFRNIAHYVGLRDGFEPLYLEDSAKSMMHTLSDIRESAAYERNRLIVQLRTLDSDEKNRIYEQWRLWVLGEMSMCSRARQVLDDMDAAAGDSIKHYCLDCIDAAQYLL